MTWYEEQVLSAVRALRRSPCSPVSATTIADYLGYKDRSSATRRLSRLKRRGVVVLPYGRCSGWVEAKYVQSLP